MRALVALAVIALIAFAAATVVEDPEIEIWSFDRFTEYVSSLPEDQRHRDPNITNPNVAPHASFASWSRENCMNVANTWFKAGVKYNWSPTTLQLVTSQGNYAGKYRSDCSGFVSACWNYQPPGYTTRDIPANTISASQLQPCDAILNRGSHIAMFYKTDGAKKIFVEECGHSCCGSQNSCPGRCQPGATCSEYCDGCPVQHLVRSDFSKYTFVRRPGW